MATVTLNGNTYTDDANAVTGLANGGHRVRFIPALSDFLAEAALKIAAADAAGAAQVALAAGHAAAADADRVDAQAARVGAEAAQDGAETAQTAAETALSTINNLLNNPDYTGTSTTTLSLGLGDKTFTTQTGKQYYPGMSIRLFNAFDAYMTGVCTSYTSGTGSMTVSMLGFVGTGSRSSWTVGLGVVEERVDASADALVWSLIFSD